MIRVTCQNCNLNLSLDDKYAGRAATCPSCGAKIVLHLKVPPGVIVENLHDHDEDGRVSKGKARPQQQAAVDISSKPYVSVLVTIVGALAVVAILIAAILFIPKKPYSSDTGDEAADTSQSDIDPATGSRPAKSAQGRIGGFGRYDLLRRKLEARGWITTGESVPILLRGQPLRQITFALDPANSTLPTLQIYHDDNNTVMAIITRIESDAFIDAIARSGKSEDKKRAAAKKKAALSRDSLLNDLFGLTPHLDTEHERVTLVRNESGDEQAQTATGLETARRYVGTQKKNNYVCEYTCDMVPAEDKKYKLEFQPCLTTVFIRDEHWPGSE